MLNLIGVIVALAFFDTVLVDGLTPNDITGKLGPGCAWEGSAPLCRGECPSGAFELIRTDDDRGFDAYISFGVTVPPQRWSKQHTFQLVFRLKTHRGIRYHQRIRRQVRSWQQSLLLPS
ncbi:hypothetical protein CALCODRAFT_303923 [Calocera cornea HHB12733]|uniref:Uncharacterized protein n=1 Tax=Calocera cornea HHB12733 TaxID=1353952 RepID=A0A165JKM3_9BASI|nr:hypothetical protein CALCODRAFT_303923 [Calocera cornea HHB12733]